MMLCMGRQYQDIRSRMSPEFYLTQYIRVEQTLDRLANVKHLGDLANIIKDGPGGWNISTRDYCDDGVPFLGVSDIHNGLDFERKPPTHITWKKHRELKKTQVQPRDVLLSVRGTVGISTVVPEEIGECHISASLVRIELREGIDPEYVSLFFHTDLGWLQVQRYGYKAAQPDVNLSEVRSVRIPVPSPERQHKIVTAMQAARAERSMRLQEAKRLRLQARDFVLKYLGIRWPIIDERTVYPSQYRDFLYRFDAPFYHPKRIKAHQAIINSGLQTVHLGNLTDLREERLEPKDFPADVLYLGLGNIESDTGEPVGLESASARNVRSAANVFRRGDVLYGRLRPYLNKVFHADTIDFGLCSTEFLVVQPKPTVNAKFLTFFLQSSVVVSQTKHMMTGNTLPRIPAEDFSKLLIPLPERQTQDEIARQVTSLRNQARQLEEDADKDMETAIAKVEAMILGQE